MDRRTKYTKKIIKDTLISLLNKKEISNITVSEICTISDINRATFYRYYLDIYDLLDQIQKEFVNSIKEKSKINNSMTVSEFAYDFLSVIVENKEFVKTLFNTKNNIYFLEEILDIACDRCNEKWLNDNPNITQDEIDYASIFIFNGSLGIINYWIKNDFDKDIKEITNYIEELSYYGTKKFIYKENIK